MLLIFLFCFISGAIISCDTTDSTPPPATPPYLKEKLLFERMPNSEHIEIAKQKLNEYKNEFSMDTQNIYRKNISLSKKHLKAIKEGSPEYSEALKVWAQVESYEKQTDKEVKKRRKRIEEKNRKAEVGIKKKVDKELKKQLGHHPFITAWEYDKQDFKIKFDNRYYQAGMVAATLMTTRLCFESNKAPFPQNIVIFGVGEVQQYPFSNIPTLILDDKK